MKLLRIKASHFKNCSDNFTIDLTAKSKKTSEDKEYELQEIAEGLFVYNTAAFVGKNASGKTTAVELLDCCYSILGDFRLEGKHYDYEGVELEIIFYHEGKIYRYATTLKEDHTFANKAIFTNQQLGQKVYYKSRLKTLFDSNTFEELNDLGDLPEDTASVFFVLKKRQTYAVYFDCDGEGVDTYSLLFKMMKSYNITMSMLVDIIQIFDENIQKLEMIDEHNYSITYQKKKRILSDKELIWLLSSGTTKGMLLYTMAVASLQNGFDLVIDEIEDHFHKTLVENMLSLYKDKTTNRKNATLIFTTHYCEVLDLFNRQDNIWICKANSHVSLFNMYEHYDIRSALLKSKQFYSNVFKTAVNYENLMTLKKRLMQ